MLLGARNTIHSGVGKIPYWGLCFTAATDEPVTLRMESTGSVSSLNIDLESSTDGVLWDKFIPNETEVTLSKQGEYVYLRAGKRGNNGFATSTSNYYRMVFSGGTVAASGNIQSLFDGKTPSNYIYSSYALLRFFYQAVNLVSAPDLPATSLSSYCYYNMFSGCTSLEETPLLGFSDIPYRACFYMFSSCTGLQRIRSATNLFDAKSDGSCWGMFYGCTSLEDSSYLTVQVTGYSVNYSLREMFKNCTSLKKAPNIGRSNMYYMSFDSMFAGCVSLVEPPPRIYGSVSHSDHSSYMFDGCSSMTYSPDLDYGGAYMFRGCSKLSSITIRNAAAHYNWVDGVATTGVFRCSIQYGTDIAIKRGLSYCPEGWSVENVDKAEDYPKIPNEADWGFYVEALEDDSVFNIVEVLGSSGQAPYTYDLQYSVTEGRVWSDWGEELEFKLHSKGQRVYFRQSRNNSITQYGTFGYRYNGLYDATTDDYGGAYRRFNMSQGKFAVGGNPMSLLAYGDEEVTEYKPRTADKTFCPFYHLFDNCTNLVDASKLNLNIIIRDSYIENLQVISFFSGMFYGCTSLTQAPELPATTLTQSCYSYMFYGCTSLTQAPELPATTLAQGCYSFMFRGCTSLTQAPELLFTTLAGMGMCCSQMFYGCTNLQHITTRLRAFEDASVTRSWVAKVASEGTFVCPAELGTNDTIKRGSSYCPTNWTVVNVD